MSSPYHQALIEALVTGESPKPRAWAKLCAQSDPQDLLGLTLLAMTCDAELIESAAKAQGWDLREAPTGVMRLATLHMDWPEIERGVDKALAKGQVRVAADLVRACVPWTHEVLDKWLDMEHRRAYAALLLATVEPEVIEQWCQSDRPERAKELIEPLRALALVESDQALDFLLDVRQELADDDDRDALKVRERLDGFIAVASPIAFARGILSDELEASWLRRPEALADVFAVHGVPSWLETLAYLEVAQTMTAFEFAALLAYVASTSVEIIVDEARHAQTLALLEAIQGEDPSWEGLALELGVQIPLGLGDEELTPLLVEIALHERLLASALEAPGILGLPLSSTEAERCDIDAAALLFERADQEQGSVEDETVVLVVRTLLDVVAWSQREPALIEELRQDPSLLALAEHANGAINLAARRAIATLNAGQELPAVDSARAALSCAAPWTDAREQLELLAKGDTVASLWAIERAGALPWPQNVELLGQLWLEVAPTLSTALLDIAREACVRVLEPEASNPE